MYLDTYLPHVAETEELQLGQIYFLLPLSQSQNPLSLSELCALAIKASTALTRNEMELSSLKALKYPGGKDVTLPSKSRSGRQIPARYSNVRLGSKMGRGNRGGGRIDEY
ncbi:Protein of unknown function DUF4228 [Macleaya cordata]|uniref:Uncharacterized protein n=1 Tax=Macleaya cordata TaxID=56857 RepID=A0A200Q403_MACCD|nr:Protein of unknown function DUF4228 [Macleaya cordata]